MLNLIFNIMENIKIDFEMDYVFFFFLRIIYLNQFYIDINFKLKIIKSFLNQSHSFDYFSGLNFKTNIQIEDNTLLKINTLDK